MIPPTGRQIPRPPLLVITDRRQASRPLEEIAAAVFEAGGRWLLLREKDMTPAERLALTERLVEIARPYGATVSVSTDLAAAKAAQSLHLPRDGDVAAARAALGPEALIGRSAHDRAEAEAAAGADYITLSPVFVSASKPGYGPALGPEGLHALAAKLPIPVIALGGVTEANASTCLEAGAGGIAVMGAVMAADDPGAVVERLLANF